jgi:hypothetical protein
MEGSSRGLLGVLFKNLPRRPAKNQENLQDSQSPGRNINPRRPEYQTVVLPTRPRVLENAVQYHSHTSYKS